MKILFGIIGVITLMLAPFAAWVTHILRCFNEDQWGFLIAGAIMFPIAVVHGILIWIGAV